MAFIDGDDTKPLDLYASYAARVEGLFSPREWCSKHPLAQPYPNEWLESRWLPLAKTLLVIRRAVGAPISITPSGGYRCPEHNRAIGGAPASQHLEGRAADFVVRHALWDAPKVHALVLELYSRGELPGLTGLGLYPKFVHIDVGDPQTLKLKRLRRWNGSKKQEA